MFYEDSDQGSVFLSDVKQKELNSFKGEAFKEFFSKTFDLFIKTQPKGDPAVTWVMEDFHDLAKKKWRLVSLTKKRNFFEKSKKNKKRGKKVKDPNAPKKPLNSFAIFSLDYRSKMGKDSVTAPSMRDLSEKWSDLDQETKGDFVELAAVDKLRYEAEKKSYDLVHKGPPKPKKGLTAFFIFSGEKRSEMRASNPEAKLTEIGKLLGKAWQDLDETARKPYFDKALEDRQRYQDEMESYRKALDNPSQNPSTSN